MSLCAYSDGAVRCVQHEVRVVALGEKRIELWFTRVWRQVAEERSMWGGRDAILYFYDFEDVVRGHREQFAAYAENPKGSVSDGPAPVSQVLVRRFSTTTVIDDACRSLDRRRVPAQDRAIWWES